MENNEIIAKQRTLEDDLKVVVKQVSSLATAVSTVDTNVNNLAKQFYSVANDVKQISNKPFNWQTLFVGIGLVVTLWVAAIKPLSTSIEKLQEHRNETTAELIARAEFMGSSKAKSEQLRKEIETIKSEMSNMLKSRFTHSDGEAQRKEMLDMVRNLERLVYDGQIKEGHK